jgi:FMN phosphatase YigB (HAD superfamily)
MDRDQYLSLVNRAKIISFDVFDTLIHRQVILPTDLFAIVERIIALEGFAEQRRAAEARARRRAAPKTIEICLDDIYAVFPSGFLTDPDRVKAIELEVERDFTYANGAMRSIVDELRAEGRRVVAISDTYMSGAHVEALLSANDIKVDDVYTSSDHRHGNLGKYNGLLFPEVSKLEQVEPADFLHVGDHPGSDVANPLSQGMIAIPNAFLATRSEHFAAVMDSHGNLSSSLVAGTIARSKLSDRARLETSIETYGYDFGGPLVVGMVLYMLERCREQGIDRLVLLARDGCVVGDVLDVLKPEGLSYRVMPCSRRLAVFPAFASGGFDKIKILFAGQKRLSKRQILAILRLDHLVEAVIDADLVMDVRAATEQMEPQLREQAQSERAALLHDLAPEMAMLEDGRRFAWVDVGWALSAPTRLNELLGHDIPTFFVGSHRDANPSPGFDGYLFTLGKPHSFAKLAMRSVELFELVFADTMPSSAYLRRTPTGTETVHYAKSPAETVRDTHICAARRGVKAFAEDIAPVVDILSPSEMRDYNRDIWKRICTDPPAGLYKQLTAVPHDAVAGTMNWRTIGDLWLPSWKFDRPNRKAYATELAYRLAHLRRHLKWHLPPSVFNRLRQAEGIIRRYV